MFTTVDRLSDTVRRRLPGTAFTVAVGALLATVGVGAYLVGLLPPPRPWAVAWPLVLLVPALLLVGLRGVGAVPALPWTLSLAPLVALYGFGPLLTARVERHDWVVTLWLFLVGQLVPTVLATLDELVRRRHPGPAGHGTPAVERQTRRRLLQVRIVTAVLTLAVVVTTLDTEALLDEVTGSGLGLVAGLVLVQIFLSGLLAVVVRRRLTAWTAAGAVAVLAVVVLAGVAPAERASAAPGYGPLFLAAGYLLLKAGAVGYWPWSTPMVPAPAAPAVGPPVADRDPRADPAHGSPPTGVRPALTRRNAVLVGAVGAAVLALLTSFLAGVALGVAAVAVGQSLRADRDDAAARVVGVVAVAAGWSSVALALTAWFVVGTVGGI